MQELEQVLQFHLMLNFTTSTTATGATLTSGAWSIVDGVNLIQ